MGSKFNSPRDRAPLERSWNDACGSILKDYPENERHLTVRSH